jgi:hypothetical protein
MQVPVTHQFCPICGVNVIGRIASQGRSAVNSRTLWEADEQGRKGDRLVDVDAYARTKANGKTEMGGEYQPKFGEEKAWEGSVGEGEKVYKGNCLCGKVRYAMKSKDLEECSVGRCDCSYCAKVGRLPFPPYRTDTA